MNLALKWFLSLTPNLANIELRYSTSTARNPKAESMGILKEVLSRIILAQRLCHMAIKVTRSIVTTETDEQVHNYSALLHDSNLNAFQAF